MGGLLKNKVKKSATLVDMEIFGALCDIAKKHGCEAGTLFGVFIAAGLEKWEPDFRKSMKALFGKESDKAVNALHLEGWIGGGQQERQTEPSDNIHTPVDALADTWTRLTGESIPTLSRRRLYSQMCTLHAGGPAKMLHGGAELYRILFPQGSFATFVSDAYKHSDSMDKAVACRGENHIDENILSRWKRIWAVASKVLPGTRFSSDPYVFFCCAVNPHFHEVNFAKNLATYSPWDAMTVSTKKTKKQPNPEALLSGH